ncbi:MAG: lipocalin-like domain-containing protein, partial [Acidiferrobacterales bacterium]|nr:lipocalin-like domain-containing protein [Acidiferrobacterales bacterium]
MRQITTLIGWLILLNGVACVGGEQDKNAIGDSARSITQALSNGSASGFVRAYSPRQFVFPADHGPHPEYKHEWWYITGNLRTDAGRHFGFQLTFFRFGLRPDAARRTSNWATNQLYMAHFTLSDVASEKFHRFERFSRAAAGLAGATVSPFRVWLEDWLIESATGRPVGRRPSLRLYASAENIAIDLIGTSEKPIVLQGERGLSRKSATLGNASYYYSATRLRTDGVIQLGEQRFAVEGLSWLDREWATSVLDDDQAGWDWFAIQLADGYELMFYQLRTRAGKVHPFSQGTFVAPDGSVRRLELDNVQLDVRDHWTSTRTGTRYPSRWHLSILDDDVRLQINPYMMDQEL